MERQGWNEGVFCWSTSTQTEKEGRNGFLNHFQQLRSYPKEIETQNWEEIPFSSRIVPRGLSVAKGPPQRRTFIK